MIIGDLDIHQIAFRGNANAGTWTVTGTCFGKSDTATLTVISGPALDHIVINPSAAAILAGDTQAYTAEAFNQSNVSLGNVTAATTFSIEVGAGGT